MTFTPTFRKDQAIQTRHGHKMAMAVAIEDSRMSADCFGELREHVRYKRWTGYEWHHCNGAVSSFYAVDRPPTILEQLADDTGHSIHSWASKDTQREVVALRLASPKRGDAGRPGQIQFGTNDLPLFGSAGQGGLF